MMKKIATHNKIFHADEVTAIALLKLFTDDEYQIERVDHDTTDFNSFDMVIDIGKKFDGVKYFDHHQYKGGKSSAGLIWSYLGFEDEYPKISKLIDLIDRNDVGLEKAKEFEYSSLIKCFNNSGKITGEEQDIQFEKAVEFAMTVFGSMKQAKEDLDDAKYIVNNSYNFNRNPKIIELDEFTPHWTTYINGELMPHIKVVVWEDEEENNWKAKVTPKRLGSFELNGKPFHQDNSMEFVHSSGHFAIASSREVMEKYLRRLIK
jgi:uncharacterized UPF0160 family protein